LIRIHFPFTDDSKPYLPIAAACCRKPFPRPFGLTSAGRFESLRTLAPQFFQATPLGEADVVFYPHCYEASEEVLAAAELARKQHVPCVFVKYGDDSSPVEVPYGVVLKESISASKRLPHEDVIPPFIVDPLTHSENLEIRPYQPLPTVGFCGFVGSAHMLPSYYLVGRRRKIDGLLLRRRAIRTLRRSERIETKFVLRKQYWGGAKHLARRPLKLLWNIVRRKNNASKGRWNAPQEAKVYSEFILNVLSSDYTLCVRGAGNYSYRFYETLAAGRVPLFVNTDCVLPFAGRIPWRRHCVWVEAEAIDQLEKHLMEFHSALDQEAFRLLQLSNRHLYEKYLSPVGFYRQALEDILRHSKVLA
jgi:hypothetical protein